MHDILNPADGRPATAVRSVTVIGPDATLADALATTLFVMGVEPGMTLLTELPGYEALMIVADGKVYYSGGLRPE